MICHLSLCVVDTNVPVAASERASVTPGCVLACTRALEQIMKSGCIVLDDKWLILREYMNNLSPSGQPGLGDRFLKWVLTNQANADKCVLVRLTPKAPQGSGFVEFPDHPGLAGFDPSDRVFVAVTFAHVQRPPILQAADSKWWGWKDALRECGVEVRFLCPEEIAGKYAKKMGKP